MNLSHSYVYIIFIKHIDGRMILLGELLFFFFKYSFFYNIFFNYNKCNSQPTAYYFVKWKALRSNSLRPHGLYSPWNSPGQNIGVGSLSLLQGIFLNQGSNSGLLNCRQFLYQLSHKKSPRILEWVAYPFFLGSSWPMNPTSVSCIVGECFTNWAIREGLLFHEFYINNSLKMLNVFRTPRMLFFSNWKASQISYNLIKIGGSPSGWCNMHCLIIFPMT